MKPPAGPAADPGDEGDLLTITFLPEGTGVRLAGDVDLTNHDRLRHALASFPASAEAIHLDLAELRFIDVAGAREVVRLTENRPAPRLILHDPPRTLRRLISLLWPAAQVEIRESIALPLPRQPGQAD